MQVNECGSSQGWYRQRQVRLGWFEVQGRPKTNSDLVACSRQRGGSMLWLRPLQDHAQRLAQPLPTAASSDTTPVGLSPCNGRSAPGPPPTHRRRRLPGRCPLPPPTPPPPPPPPSALQGGRKGGREGHEHPGVGLSRSNRVQGGRWLRWRGRASNTQRVADSQAAGFGIDLCGLCSQACTTAGQRQRTLV